MSGVGDLTEGWYPDPFGRHELRHYDGRWTDAVTTNGRRHHDQPGGQPRVPTLQCPPEEIRRVAASAGAVADAPHDAPLFTQRVLVFSTESRESGVSTEFAVFDGHGHQVGAIREVGQRWTKHLSKFINFDVLRARNLQIVDMAGAPVVVIKRPLSLIGTIMRAQYLVKDGRGRPLGQFAQSFTAQFELTWGEGLGASIKQRGWSGWSGEFTVGTISSEIARITRSRASGTLHYVLELIGSPEDRLRRLLLAAPVVVDVTRRHVDTFAD